MDTATCIYCKEKFTKLPDNFIVHYEKESNSELIEKHYWCMLRYVGGAGKRLESNIANYNYDAYKGWGFSILLVSLCESFYNFRKFFVSWVSFTLFIMIFDNYAWIGFVMCLLFMRKRFISYVIVCLFSWLGYYVVDSQPVWIQYPHMAAKDVLFDLILMIVKALFMMRAIDIYNSFLVDERAKFIEKQERLMLHDMVISATQFNNIMKMLLAAFALSFLPIFPSFLWFFHRFDLISVVIGALSWILFVAPHKRHWFPIEINFKKKQ